MFFLHLFLLGKRAISANLSETFLSASDVPDCISVLLLFD